jgi:dCTP deaminase
MQPSPATGKVIQLSIQERKMGLKPDHWIRKMAREHAMIEPFTDHQVRDGVISYGVSSYGYDIRVADEFKIFTNVFSAVVDPKDFDTKSMVDFQGDVCIIPPNSFALARTVEYFRIPRSVLTVCLGKSSYARCFRGDTRVALVDGSAPTLEEMARRSETGEIFWGYSVGQYGRVIVTMLNAPRYIGKDALIELVLDSGESIFCTNDHRFLTRDGRMVEAHELRPGSSLMPLYRQAARGYEMVYQPLDRHLYPTHRLADEWNLRYGVYQDAPGTHRRHLDGNRRNNRPWNVVRNHDPAERQRQSKLIKTADVNRSFRRQQTYDVYRNSHYSVLVRGSLPKQSPGALLSLRAAEALRGGEAISPSRGGDCGSGEPCSPKTAPPSHKMRIADDNHKVVSIREVPGEQDVYCLTVPEAGNFALEAGVFVSNCGIIVNVTPFEPEWEGYVTLEISNTTPLPAKIYANEGIAQVLFFEADEECEVSYADKKGKYQRQDSIVLPRL